MRTLDRWSTIRGSRPVAAERALTAGAALLVGVVSLWQFGLTPEGAFRAISLGTWTAVGAWFVLRRRRLADARESAARDALRLALARELHDTVAGDVAAIGIHAAAAGRVAMVRPAEAAEALGRIEDLARSANPGLRRMLDALRAGELEASAAHPTLAALPELAAAQTLGRAGVVRMTVDPHVVGALDPVVDGAAFRIIEEAVRNARGHAGSVPIDVAVNLTDGALDIRVQNGPGRPGVTWPGSGHGLIGMRERATQLGGR